MAINLEQILTTANAQSSVQITLVSNQNDGIASYTEGALLFHPQSGGIVLGRPIRPAHMESTHPLNMFFSDRKLAIDPPPPPGQFGISPRQHFNANQPESLTLAVSVSPGEHEKISVNIGVFNNSVKFSMDRLGDLYVGIGPSLGQSSGTAFILAFIGVTNPPR